MVHFSRHCALISLILTVLNLILPVSCFWPQMGGNSLQNRIGSFDSPYSPSLPGSSSPSLLFNTTLPANIATSLSNFSPCGSLLWSIVGSTTNAISSYLLALSPISGKMAYNYSIPSSFGSMQTELVCNQQFMIIPLTIGYSYTHATLVALSIPSAGSPPVGLLVDPFNPSHHLLAASHQLTPIPVSWQYSTAASGLPSPKIYNTKYVCAQFNTTLTVLQIETGAVLATFNVFPAAAALIPGGLTGSVYVPFLSAFQWQNGDASGFADTVELWVPVWASQYSSNSPALIIVNFRFSTLQFQLVNSYLISAMCPPASSHRPTWSIGPIWGDENDPEQRVLMLVMYTPRNNPDRYKYALLAVGMPRSNPTPIFFYSPRTSVYPYQGDIAQITGTVLLPDFSLSTRHAEKKSRGSSHTAKSASYSGPSSFLYIERTLSLYVDDCDAPSNTSLYSIVSMPLPSSSQGLNQTIQENWRIPLPHAYSECGYAVQVYSLSQMNSRQAFFRWNSLFTKQNPPPFGASAWRIGLEFGEYQEILDYSPGWTYIAGAPTFVIGTDEGREVAYGFEPDQNYGYRWSSMLQGWQWN